MQIIYVCPKCGADLIDSVITTNPPRARKECSRCDWFWEEKPEDVVRVPFVPPEKPCEKQQDLPEPVSPWMFGVVPDADYYMPDCCWNCSNHPRNGGSGICNCTLPYMTWGITAPKGRADTTTYTIQVKDDGTYHITEKKEKNDGN